MLNLQQIQKEIKSGPTPRPNLANPFVAMNELYRELKTLGWQSTNTIHPTDRVSTLTLEGATIRRDKAQAPGFWIIEADGQDYPFTGSPTEATDEARRLLTPEVLPAPISPLKQAALDLQAEYPKMVAWIERGLALAEVGVASFPQYNTRYSPETFYGHRECDCPARAPYAKFGKLCKHTACQEIIFRAASESRATAYRELVSDLERERSRVGVA